MEFMQSNMSRDFDEWKPLFFINVIYCLFTASVRADNKCKVIYCDNMDVIKKDKYI